MNDLAYAFHQLRKSPGFTAVAILTLALGIGMNTSMFSMLNGFMLRPLAFPHPEQLFRLYQTHPPESKNDVTASNFAEVTAGASAVADLAGFRFSAFTLTEPNKPADVPIGLRVTPNYFNVLGLVPQLGRNFVSEEARHGKDNVVVISHRYWQSRFGGDENILGRIINLDGTAAAIIGVLPAQDDTTRLLAPIGIYRPLVWSDAEIADRTASTINVLGRYRPGIDAQQATVQLNTIAQRLSIEHPAEDKDIGLLAESLQSTMLRGTGRIMTFLLIGLSGFVLLIACANLANLLLARALSRAREFSIRAALGASRSDLIKPLVVESLLLAGLGGMAATLVSAWTTDWLAQRFGSPDNPVNFSADARVLLFTIAVSLVTVLLFGVGPAWWAAHVDVNGSLKNTTRGATSSRAQNRYRSGLIVTQFALALMLLAGAGFFLRGLGQLVGANPGWKPAPLISGVLNLASAKYNAAEPIVAFHRALRDKLLILPGVANAAVAFEAPLFESPSRRSFLVEGREPPAKGQEIMAFTNAVSSSYFDTVGTRLLRGRTIDDSDQTNSRPVVVINEAMARALFPAGDALGQRLGLAGQPETSWAEIVGIVEDAKPLNIGPTSVRFQVYKPFTQEAWQYVTILVRAKDPAQSPGLIEPIRRAVASLDADQPVMRLMTIPARIQQNTTVWQTINQLLMLFAGLGVLLSALGIYGVITRVVQQRTGEFGIRLAIGAQTRDILQLVLAGGARLALVGTTLGLIGAIGLGRFLNSAMPGLGGPIFGPTAIAAAALILVGLGASYLPALRATKVNPITALRAE